MAAIRARISTSVATFTRHDKKSSVRSWLCCLSCLLAAGWCRPLHQPLVRSKLRQSEVVRRASLISACSNALPKRMSRGFHPTELPPCLTGPCSARPASASSRTGTSVQGALGRHGLTRCATALTVPCVTPLTLCGASTRLSQGRAIVRLPDGVARERDAAAEVPVWRRQLQCVRGDAARSAQSAASDGRDGAFAKADR